jgi:hypothetical protein
MPFPELIARASLFICLLAPPVGLADSLVIPDIANQPQAAPDNAPRPARAMTMDQVRDQFGSPREVMGPVGNPPITRWIYGDFVVTFESEYVIHSAAKRQ